MTRRMHLGAHLPGIDTASGQAGFGLLADVARTAERGRFDFLVRGEDGSDACTVLAALAAVTDRVGLVGTVDPAVAQPYHAARRWASLDHLCAGRAAWHIDPVGGGSDRAESFLTAAHTLFDAWRTDDIIADRVPANSCPAPMPVNSPTRTDILTSSGDSACRAARRPGPSSSGAATAMPTSSPRPAAPTSCSVAIASRRRAAPSTPTSRAGWHGTVVTATSC